MALVRASEPTSMDVSIAAISRARATAARVYVRHERCGCCRFRTWGIEHGGQRSEIVEPLVPGRPPAPWAAERDLRRGVGLF
jgi:hypothetical protein